MRFHWGMNRDMATIPHSTLYGSGYEAWLGYASKCSGFGGQGDMAIKNTIVITETDMVSKTAAAELCYGIEKLTGMCPSEANQAEGDCIAIGTFRGGNPVISKLFPDPPALQTGKEGFAIQTDNEAGIIAVGAATPVGVLYGVFHLLRCLGSGKSIKQLECVERPVNIVRMMNQWDNIDGSIERGYAGKSIFYENNSISKNKVRMKDYARMLASVGINAICINNVNVHKWETLFLTDRYLPELKELSQIFRSYGISMYMSINFAAPIEIGGIHTADPLDEKVRGWWREKAKEIYGYIPDFGGFLVKADSEGRPGPFTYARTHADGANMLGEALKPYGGIVIWRCFVYNCMQDWRDRSTDRARAAFDHFKPIDGEFMENVVLQIKNGPMDFQVREPVSPLFGAMQNTNMLLELQITQEYTGQQRHLCYLLPQWKEILDFDTYVKGEGSTIKRIVDGSVHHNKISGMAAVSNIGDDSNWTGHLLAQANLYGFGRLAWNPDVTSEQITEEWVRLTLGNHPVVVDTVCRMLLASWQIYESYTAPLGVGWMVNPDHHYGPNVDGYEYSRWGTYHFADHNGIGVDRTSKTGTGYIDQYVGANREQYESIERCPDELLLFFHHVPYTHVLQSGKTVIQHIYDSHFEGVEKAESLLKEWESLQGLIHEELYTHVRKRLLEQAAHSKEWSDIINTYFYRKSGIPDQLSRKIYY
jgi:alpha-glucuronidase